MFFKEITVERISLSSWRNHQYFYFISFDEFPDVLFPDDGLRNIFMDQRQYKSKIFSFEEYKNLNISEKFLWYLCSCEKRFGDYSRNIIYLYKNGKRIIGSTYKKKPHEYVMNYVLYLLHVHSLKLKHNIVARSRMASFVFRDVDTDKETIQSVMKNINTRIILGLYLRGKSTLENLENNAHCYVDFDSTYLLCRHHDMLTNPPKEMNFQFLLERIAQNA